MGTDFCDNNTERRGAKSMLIVAQNSVSFKMINNILADVSFKRCADNIRGRLYNVFSGTRFTLNTLTSDVFFLHAEFKLIYQFLR